MELLIITVFGDQCPPLLGREQELERVLRSKMMNKRQLTLEAPDRAVTHDLADRGLADVAAVCCVGQGPTMVPVDDSGRARP